MLSRIIRCLLLLAFSLSLFFLPVPSFWAADPETYTITADDTVTRELESAAAEQRKAEDAAESAVDSSIRYADRASSRLSDAQSIASRIIDRNSQLAGAAAAGQAGLADSKQRIAACQQILSGIQKAPTAHGK